MRATFARLGLILTLALAATAPAGAGEATRLKFDEVYAGSAVLGLTFTPKVGQLNGAQVAMRGFMAPPLKAEAEFFVLTREPVALCPFCNSDADWPVNIVVVYPAGDQTWVDNSVPIEVTGTLEVGPAQDKTTGFYSRMRLVDAHFRPLG